MFKRSKLTEQQVFIARSSVELAPKVGDRINWVSPMIGAFALFNVAPPGSSKTLKPPFFELIAAGKIDLRTEQFPEYHYFYDGKATIYGVSHIYSKEGILSDSSFMEEKAEEINFQIDNGLIVPSSEDYDKVEEYLKNGKLDALRNG